MKRSSLVRSIIVVSIILILAFSTAGCARKAGNTGTATPASSTAAPMPGTGVPPEYRALYSSLSSDMDSYSAYLDTHDTGKTYPVTFGAELLPANSNRGEDLLKPGAFEGVKAYLDRLQEMGVNGVTVAVDYPLYSPSNPRYGDYVSFYKQVAQEVKKRNMRLDVEAGVIFTGTTFSKVSYDFSAISYDQYKAADKQMVQAIINDMHPDYLNLGGEPDTAYLLTGYKEFKSPDEYVAFFNYILDGTDRGNTKLGGGTGSWSGTEYAKRLASGTSLDFIDVHVYPVYGDFLPNVIAIADIAHQYNKSVVLDEMWPQKTDRQVPDMAANADIFKLDAYGFWAPLDQRFLELVVKAARAHNIEYISPFWANYFFAYLDYGPDNSQLSYESITSMSNKAAVNNIVGDRFTSTGEYYKKLIAENR